MVQNVDPFIVDIPSSFHNDPELLSYTTYLHNFLHDLWLRTGGGDDSVAELQGINTFETTSIMAKVSALCDRVDHLEALIVAKPGVQPADEEPVTRPTPLIDLNELYALVNRLAGRVSALNNKLEEAEDKAWL